MLGKVFEPFLSLDEILASVTDSKKAFKQHLDVVLFVMLN